MEADSPATAGAATRAAAAVATGTGTGTGGRTATVTTGALAVPSDPVGHSVRAVRSAPAGRSDPKAPSVGRAGSARATVGGEDRPGDGAAETFAMVHCCSSRRAP